MPIFPDPNGGSMQVANEAEARARGWTPAMGTFGAQSYPTAGGGGGAVATDGGGIGGRPLTQDEQDVLNSFKASSGLSIKDLEEKKRQFDQTLAFQKQQWEQAGLSAAEVARRVQEAQIAEIQSQIQLATANVTGYYQTPVQPVDPSQFAGLDQATKDTYLRYNGNNPQAAAAKWAQDATRAVQQAAGPGQPTEAARQFNVTSGEAQRQFNARLGLDYMTQAAQMGGPADWAQLSNFYRGAQGNPQIPVFLSALQNGVTMPAFGATGSSAPGVQSPDAIAQRLTGMPTQGGTNMDQSLGLFNAIGRTGGTGLAPQALEQLNPDELAMFGSGIKAAGFSMPTLLSSYKASRIGQTAATPLG